MGIYLGILSKGCLGRFGVFTGMCVWGGIWAVVRGDLGLG